MQRVKGLFLIVILFFVCGSLQKETFNPIKPGSLHVDRFTPLTGSRVNVPEFTTVDFGASVLDFETIKVTNPVNIDIAGSVFFEGDDVAFTSDGYLYVSTEVNDLPINALHGQLSGTTTNDDIIFWAYTSDITIDSANSDITFTAPLGSAEFEGASVLLQGRQNTKGVNLSAKAIKIDAGTSENRISSQVNLEGQDISVDLTSSATITSLLGDIEISGGKGVAIGGYDVVILSDTGISTTADVGDILLESDASFSISANDVKMFSSNSQVYQAVSGDISLSSTSSSFVQALDSIVISSFSGDINFNSRNDLSVTAGNGIYTRSLGQTSINGYDFIVQSKYDEVNFIADGSVYVSTQAQLTVTSYGDSYLEADFDVFVTAAAVYFNSEVDTTLTAGEVASFSATNNLEFNSNYLYQDYVVDYTYHGNSLDFVSEGNLDIESGLNINFNAYNDMKISSEEAIFLSQSLLEFEGNVTSTISGNSLDISSGQNTLFTGDSLDFTIGGTFSQTSANANYTSEQQLEFTSGNNFVIDANSINMYGTAGMSFTADDIDASYVYEATFTSTTTTVTSSTVIFFDITNNIYFTQDGDLEFSSSQTIYVSPLISSFTAGSAEITSDTLEIIDGDSHYYARKNFEVSANSITINNADNIVMASDSTLDFTAGDVTINAFDNFNILATDAFGGDISMTSSADFKIDSSKTLMTGDLVQWDGDTWSVTSGTSYFGCCGNLELNAQGTTSITSSNSYFTISAESSFNVHSGNTVMSAQRDSFTIVTNFDGDISFAGGNVVLSAATTMTFTSEYISYSGSGEGSVSGTTSTISSNTDMHIISTADFLFDAINFSQTSESTSYTGLSSVYVDSPSTLSYTMDTGVINANGGGARFINNGTATNDITSFLISNLNANSGFRYNFEVDAYNLVAFNAGETVTMSSGCTLSIIGGTSEYFAGADGNGNMIFNSLTTFMAYAGGFGNYTMTASYDFISEADTAFTVTGYEGARNGFITTNHNDSDLCIRSDFNSGSTIFDSAESIDVFARGQDESFLQMFADQSVYVTTNEYAVGVISEGFQTDIQFEINDTIGILLRTTKQNVKSSINIQANGNTQEASVKVFGRDGYEALSKRGPIAVNSGLNIDIRSSFYDADILIQTYSGNTSIETNNGYYTSGTPSLRYDTLINATGHITFNSGKTIITQRSTIQDPSDSAIIFEGYRGDMLVQSTTDDSTYTAQDGGGIFMEARDGDITYSSADMFVSALTGSIEMEGRTGALFSTKVLSVSAQGAGGSLHYNTSGGNDFVINQSTSKGSIVFTSTIGEFDFQTTTGLIATAVGDLTFAADAVDSPSPCTHIYGGGSTNFVSLVDITISSTETPLQFDAEVELTIDATTVDIETELLRVTAGGDGTTDGLSIQSQGDISITSNAADINVHTVGASYIANGNMVFTLNNLNVTSLGDATTENNIVFQTNNGDIIMDSSDYNEFYSRSSTIIKSESGISFTVDTTDPEAAAPINIFSAREIRKNADSVAYTIDDHAEFSVKDFLEVAHQDLSITVNVGQMGFAADNLLTIQPDHDFSMTLTNGTVVFSTLPYTDAPNSVSFDVDGAATFTVTDDANIQAYRGIDIQGLNSITLDGATSSSFTSENDMVFTTYHGNIAVGTVSDLDINAGNSFYQYSGSTFFVDVDNDMNLVARQIDFSTTGDLTISVGADIGITSRYHLTLLSESDLTVQSPIQSYTADKSLYLKTLVDLDITSPIYFQLDSIIFSASTTNGIVNFDAVGDIVIDGTDLTDTIDLLSTTGTTYFVSTGDEGVRFSGASYAQTSQLTIDMTSDSGNMFFFSDTSITMDGANIYFNATHPDGNVLTHASGALTVDFTELFVQPLTNPGTHRHSGNITFIGESATISASDDVDIGSSFNTEFSSTFGDITFGLAVTTVNFVAQIRNEIEASVSQTYNGDLIEFVATAYEADFIAEGAAISIDASDSISDNAIDIGIMAGSHVHSLSGDDHFFTSSTSMAVISDSSFISFEFQTVTYTISDRLDVQSSAGSIRSIFFDYTLTADQNLYGSTGGAVVIDSVDFAAGNDLIFISDKNIEVNVQGDVDFNSASQINFEIRREGDFRTTIGGTTSFFANDLLYFEAKGNLGALGGKYVLRDDYFDDRPLFFDVDYYPREFSQGRININTIAIEFLSVGGSSRYLATNSITLISKKGNIEIKGVINVLYSAAAGGDRITFFNVITCFSLANCGASSAANIGTLKTVPFNRSTDYCIIAQASVECSEISTELNDVVQAMINYGLYGNDYLTNNWTTLNNN